MSSPLNKSTSICFDESQKAKVIPSHRWVKCQIRRFNLPKTKPRLNESIELRRKIYETTSHFCDRLRALKHYLRYLWSEIFIKKKDLNLENEFYWEDPLSGKVYRSSSLVAEISFVIFSLGTSYANSGLEAWGRQPAKNCSHALRRGAGLFRFLRTEFLNNHKIEDLNEEMPMCLRPTILNAMEKMCVAAAQQIALCLYREIVNKKKAKSILINAKLHMGVSVTLSKALKSLSIVSKDMTKELKCWKIDLKSSSLIFEAVSHGILAMDIASKKIQHGAAVAHLNRCCELMSDDNQFSKQHLNVIRDFRSEFGAQKKRIVEENNTIYFAMVPDKVNEIDSIVLESAKPVHPMVYESYSMHDKEEEKKRDEKKEEKEKEKKNDRRRISIIPPKDICRIDVVNVSSNCATLRIHLSEELCEVFSNMDGIPVFQVAWKRVSEPDFHFEGRPLIVCNRGETLIRYTADLLLPDTLYVFRVRAGEQSIEIVEKERVSKQIESVSHWTPWSDETGAVHTEKAPLDAPPFIRVTRIWCQEDMERGGDKEVRIARSTDNNVISQDSLDEKGIVVALNVVWNAFQDETSQSSVQRYELQYRYSARAKWVRVRRGLDADSRSYVFFHIQ